MSLTEYDIVKLMESANDRVVLEAPEDETQQQAAPQQQQAPQDNNSGDNFSIDTNLEDDEQQEDQATDGGEDITDDEMPQDGAGDSAPPAEDEEEPVEANTDLFMTLSKEEQTMKIKILKKQYAQLYASCDELIARIDNLDTDESNILTINRLSESIYDLKKYLSDYFIHIFPGNSFVENDIMFNRFLDIINTITISFDKVVKDENKKREEASHD